MNFQKNIILNIVIVAVVCIIISLLMVFVQWIIYFYQMKPHLLAVMPAFSLIFAFIFSLWYLKHKNYFKTFNLIKSLFIALLISFLLDLTLNEYLSLKNITLDMSNSCSLNSSNKDLFMATCLMKTGVWWFVFSLSAWLPPILVIECIGKLNLLFRSSNH